MLLNKNRLVDIVNYINLGSALFLVTLLPFYYTHQHIAVVLFFATYILDFLIDQKWNNIKWNKKQLVFVGFLLFYALILLYDPFENGNQYLGKILEARLPFVGLGIIGLFGLNKKYNIEYFSVAFVLTSVTLICYLIVGKIGISNFISNPNRNELFTQARIDSIASHMIFDFYLNTSLIFLLLLLLKRKKIVPIFIKIPFFLCGLVIYGALFISEGRSGFIAANILIFGMIVYKIWEWRKIAGILVGLCTPFILFSIISHHPRMQNDMVKDEPRLVVWKVSEKIIAEKPYMGYGPSDAQDILMKRSMQDETILNNAYFGSFIKEGGIVNPHNQFLQTSMEFGILGVIVLLFIFLYPIVAIEKGRRIFMFFFIFITLNQAFFDVFGCAFSALTFTFVVVLLLRAHSIEKQQLIS